MTDDAVARFLRDHAAAPVGDTPPRPVAPGETDAPAETIDPGVERPPEKWEPLLLAEAPAARGEYPERFIDGCHSGRPVLCLRSPQGYPVPLILAEVGAVALELNGRQFDRTFRAVERVLGFVADPFPWAEVEAFAGALANHPGLRVRVVPARMPDADKASPFDYEAMRTQARNRLQQEMLNLERVALDAAPAAPTLIDGQLGGRIGATAAAKRPLLVGVVKSFTPPRLPDACARVLVDLPPAHRTPYFRDARPSDVPLACWFLRLAGGPELAPNWGVVRVDIPWAHLDRHPAHDRSAFVGRLSRWLVDARCRASSYARMPVSLDPIVRAEDALKPLLTPLPVLVNRLYRQAGLFRRSET